MGRPPDVKKFKSTFEEARKNSELKREAKKTWVLP